jgi:3-hydroxyacyl-CoA dehydrogenase
MNPPASPLIRKVAVLGAGVMGAQIAAHLVNVRVPVLLFDLPAKEGPKNGIVTRAIDNLKKMSPAPLADNDDAPFIEPANYDDDLSRLAECDLVIEAIAERMDWKHDLYRKVAPHVAPQAIFATNTSGLSIAKLAEGLPEELRSRFCGVHFFNPPRYMYLLELIATPATEPAVLDRLELFLTSRVGKGVVRAKDTPNFIANRVGIAGMLATMKEAENFGLGYDVVDDLTGSRMGRAKSGTFRTADIVGLDVMFHVIKTLQDNLGPEAGNDPFYPNFATPRALQQLLDAKALGQKTGGGFYKKVGREIKRWDADKGEYVAAGAKADEVVGRMMKKPAAERLKLLRHAKNPQARFVWSIIRDGLHYCAVHLKDIAETARDVDLAIRWGFGWKQGPFELWQEAGWKQVAQWIKEDIDAGLALSKAPLPDWVFDGRRGVHTAEGSWSAAEGRYIARRVLPQLAERQLYPQALRGDGQPRFATDGATVFENDGLRLWTVPRAGLDDVLVASIKTKMHVIGPSVVEGLLRGIAEAESGGYKGLVVWSGDEPFSAGADLQAMLPEFMKGGAKAIEPAERALQEAMLALRYAQVPTVAAVQGLALGGGCELAIYCARRVAALESYVGLVEVGVGLLPGAGGLTFIARRAAEMANAVGAGVDVLAFLKNLYMNAATAKVATSAIQAQKIGFFSWRDVIVPNRDELLYVAIREAQAMHAGGYRPPLPARFPVAGRSGIATIRGQLVNMRDGGFISDWDYHIGSRIAEVVCGGDVEPGSVVDERWIMALERKYFCELLDSRKTQERILGMLSTGKPLRN